MSRSIDEDPFIDGVKNGALITKRPMSSRLGHTFRTYLFQPFLVGFALAMGMSLGYSTFDWIVAKVKSFTENY